MTEQSTYYSINRDGILIYQSPQSQLAYEVWGVNEEGLVHGQLCEQFGFRYTMINNVWRAMPINRRRG